MKRVLPVVVAAALLPSPAGALELERLPPGPLPGKPAPGKFSDSVRDVRELIAVGNRYQRTRLLIARGRSDQLCVAASTGARRRARFTCLASWDRPPLLVRLGAGGGSRAKTNWLSVVGLVRAEAAAVTVESDRFQSRAVRLQGAPGFPWKAFAVAPSRTDRPLSVRARDGAGAVLQRIDLSDAFRRSLPGQRQRLSHACAAAGPVVGGARPDRRRGAVHPPRRRDAHQADCHRASGGPAGDRRPAFLVRRGRTLDEVQRWRDRGSRGDPPQPARQLRGRRAGARLSQRLGLSRGRVAHTRRERH